VGLNVRLWRKVETAVLIGRYGKFGGPFFAGNPLDRGDALRSDAAALQKCMSDSRLRIIGLRALKPLMDVSAGLNIHFISPEDLPTDWQALVPWVYLGADAAGPMAAVDLDALDQGAFDDLIQDHIKVIDLRSIAMQAAADNDGQQASILALAKATIDWHQRHGFCAECGEATLSQRGGFARKCDDVACAALHFPRTDPVVIMLITHGNSVLMGRSPGWPAGMYSLLAGFVEPGETLEAAVRREVFEESGVRVGEVSYLASQPWPFPGSLMFGWAGVATSSEITIDPKEIEDAVWVTREEMLDVFAGQHTTILPARKGAIAHFLLENWLADTLD